MKARARRLAWGVTAVLVAATFVVPLVSLVTGSLRPPGAGPAPGFELVPSGATLDAYGQATSLAPLLRSILNSGVVAFLFVPLAVVTSSMAGFAIAEGSKHLRTRLVALMVVVLVVPVTALWIARFVLFEAAGLVGTYAPLIAPALMGGSPFLVLLYAYAFWRIPTDVVDAARLEGASAWRTWRRICMPLVKPTTAAVAMLAFVQTWSNFIDPLLYLNTESTFTAPLVLRYLEQLGSTNWPVLLAGATMVAAPPMLVFALAQRWFLGEQWGLGWLGR